MPAAVRRPASDGPAWPAPMMMASKRFIRGGYFAGTDGYSIPQPRRRRVQHSVSVHQATEPVSSRGGGDAGAVDRDPQRGVTQPGQRVAHRGVRGDVGGYQADPGHRGGPLDRGGQVEPEHGGSALGQRSGGRRAEPGRGAGDDGRGAGDLHVCRSRIPQDRPPGRPRRTLRVRNGALGGGGIALNSEKTRRRLPYVTRDRPGCPLGTRTGGRRSGHPSIPAAAGPPRFRLRRVQRFRPDLSNVAQVTPQTRKRYAVLPGATCWMRSGLASMRFHSGS